MPIALNKKAATRLIEHIDMTQTYFQRQILLENLSSYIVFDDDEMSEAEFLNYVAAHSGCGLLVDVNNIFIQEFNIGRLTKDFLMEINPRFVQQYHLAGGTYDSNYQMIIDTHAHDVSNSVMALYQDTLKIIGTHPTLYERDQNIPPLSELLEITKRIKQTHLI